ncbi:MAG: decarboxylating NADP(+)-dependent phosphogluconate dehydrogenase [Thiotrichales bacterium]|nr:decarboxylating NADP(+)-dependent phosphogluconate dehydrogenase [Thiotrichales bacterium]
MSGGDLSPHCAEAADIGVIGLAVMGENLVLNIASRGYTVAVYNRTTSKVDAFLAGRAAGRAIVGAWSPQELVSKLAKPRRVMLMVQAGRAVDRVIDTLTPLLEPGDVLIDGGNSNYRDTTRRTRALREAGILYVGTGVSGGEEGALLGPSIMPGGNADAWPMLEPIFKAIAAKVEDGTPCCDWIGPDGAGHYVKMVHNGIEYGDMQMIAEAYSLLRDVGGIEPAAMSEIFARWNEGALSSYLVEITAGILARVDDATGRPLVDVILDAAGQKGTGKWTGIDSLMLGAPVTAITEAVFARALSALKDERVAASQVLPGPEAATGRGAEGGAPSFATDALAVAPSALTEAPNARAATPSACAGEAMAGRDPGAEDADVASFADDVRQALYASKICSYAQGFQLLSMASTEYDWRLDFGAIALMWRGGCIIRAAFLDRIKAAYDETPDLANLLLAPYFRAAMANAQDAWRRVVATAVLRGVPVPAFASALAWYDGYRRARLPANLLQAQRDYFGAHTYERIDRPRGEFFHTDWTGRGGETVSTAYNA